MCVSGYTGRSGSCSSRKAVRSCRCSVPTAAFFLAVELRQRLRAAPATSTEKRFVREAFRRYVSPADDRASAEGSAQASARRREARNELSCSPILRRLHDVSPRNIPPETVAVAAAGVSRRHAARSRSDHGGTVDRIVGDSIAVLFGAPAGSARPRAARRSVARSQWDRFCEAFREAQRRERGVAARRDADRRAHGHGDRRQRRHGRAIALHGARRLREHRGAARRSEPLSRHACLHEPESGAAFARAQVRADRPLGPEGQDAGARMRDGRAPRTGRDSYRLSRRLRIAGGGSSGERANGSACSLAALPNHGLPAFHWERLRRGELGARIVLEGK